MAEKKLRELIPVTTGLKKEHLEAKEALALLRTSNLYRPDLVLWLGDAATSQLRPRSIEYWDVQEQICNAAAVLREWDILKSISKRIYDRFPTSFRMRLLFGRRREALSLWPDALKTYVEIIADDPMCQLAYKRQVAVLKSQHKLQEAIAMLNYYLGHFGTDAEAWAELAVLCLEQTRISHALYAANELVLIDPNNHASQTLVADIYMTAGEKEDMILARKHYAASLSLRKKKKNLRALYGVWLASSVLESHFKLPEDEQALNQQILEWSKKAIAGVYGEMPNADEYSFVSKVLEKKLN